MKNAIDYLEIKFFGLETSADGRIAIFALVLILLAVLDVRAFD